MNHKTFTRITGMLFLAVALLQLVRLGWGWEVIVAGVMIPFWASGVAVCIAGYLAYTGIRLSK